MTHEISLSGKISIYFEDDAMVMNRMIETAGVSIQNRLINSYELDPTLKAIKAIASLIEAKARKQTLMIESALPAELKLTIGTEIKEPF